ncbi:MAG: hypothetical protein H7318_05895 [Oligoflexus sp.]|nr:hypothetical protein [Oligoflexus sp.]
MKLFMLGSSGLVGSTCYSKLLLEKEAPQIVSFSRRRLNLHGGQERVSDLKDIETLMTGLDADTALCSVGTTLKKAKSRAAFEEVDLNLPLRFAVAAKNHGVKNFHLLTALGADPISKNYYLRIKGVLEKEIRSLGFQSLNIYRPSLLLGHRDEFRLAEELATGVYRRFQAIYPKVLNKYRPIEVEKLTGFIIRKLFENPNGVQVYENQDMLGG